MDSWTATFSLKMNEWTNEWNGRNKDQGWNGMEWMDQTDLV